MNKGIERDPNWNSGARVGIGYICLPTGVDREKFVQTCYRKEKVNIVLDHGGTMVKDCYIDSSVLQRIKFPSNTKELGSQIVFVTTKFQKIPFVIACLTRTQERVISEEESFNIQREINGGLLSIVGKGDGALLINLENKTSSKLILNINGEDSVLELNNEGTTTINSENDITINSSTKVTQNVLNEEGEVDKTLLIDTEGLQYEDNNNLLSINDDGMKYERNDSNSLFIDSNGLKYEDNNGASLEIDYENGTITHNGGDEPIPLGNELQTQLNTLNNYFKGLVNAINSAAVAAGDGGATFKANIIAALTAYSDADFDNINSESSFIK